MAVTNEKKLKEEQQKAAAYTGLEGVSQNTAQQLGKYQQAYTPSQNVTQAQQTWNNLQAQKPQGYTSKYAGALDNILKQIQNPQQFKYEFNGDNLFKAYSDLYTQQGKQASLDTMGQAAGLTGGYGNSYAQNVGNQAYQQYLTKLYDVGLDLHDRAYQKYLNDLGNQKDIYNILMGADQNDYGRYRDTVADWQNEEANAYNRYANERTFDYGTYSDMLNYYTGLAQVENADYRSEAERQEAIRQFNAKMAEQIRSTDLDEAYRRDTLAEQMRSTDLDEAYRRDTLGWQQYTDARDYAYNIVKSTLANGQIPTAAMLEAAGLTVEDATLMLAAKEIGGSTGKTPTYYEFNGKLYEIKNGNYRQVDENSITGPFNVDTKTLQTKYEQKVKPGLEAGKKTTTTTNTTTTAKDKNSRKGTKKEISHVV